jgi:hypothetical protein
MSVDIDSLLAFENRTLRTLPGKLLLGPSGARLWADYLDPVPGFRGRLDFIHKLNIPLLFSVSCEGGPEEMSPPDSVWRPSMLEMNWQDEALRFREYKFITWKDQAVSLQTWENRGAKEVKLLLNLPPCFGSAPSSPGPLLDGGWAFARLPLTIHGIKPVCVFFCPEKLREGPFTLRPGERAEFILSMAVGNASTDRTEQMKADLLKLYEAGGGIEEWLERQKREYLCWFEEAPVFESSDPLLDRTWWYRWFILRHNLARPDFGNFHHTLVYEGRSHKMGKEAYKPSGWEFSKLIPLSTPLHLTDLRWYGKAELSYEAARSLCDSIDEDGLFRVLFTDESGKEYANYAGWALYRLYLVHQDISFIKEVLNFFKANARAVYKIHKGINDHLQVEANHPLTGKEYQPSYWYFAGYPDNAKDKSSYTALKRVDRSIYTYLNLLGIARLCEITGDPDKAEFLTLAGNIREDVLKKMWDGESGFFYDLHFETDEKALVKNIVGIYPLWAGIGGPEHTRALDCLFDPGVFNTGSAFASTGRDCPVFSADGGWKKQYFKGRNGCMWDGPSWPYTTGIALDAIGAQSKQYRLALDSGFMKLLRAYSLQHFQGQDIRRPYLVEHYNSVTGEAISDEADYNHSFYIDLIVRHVAGIEPERDGFLFWPCRSGLKSFSLKALRLQGHRIDVSYRAAPEAGSGTAAGIRISIDGKQVYENARLPEDAIRFSFSRV